MARTVVVLALFLASGAAPLAGQTRSLAQDSTLDNLVHPPGYRPAAPGTLGTVRRIGHGPRSMILVPGLGFGGGVFDDFMERRKDRYTMHAVTLPGFGGTAAPPMPAPGASYAETPWLGSAEAAILGLMDREGIRRTTLVAHWIGGTQVALRLALDHPERLDAVILIAGVARSFYSSTPAMLDWTAAERAGAADRLGIRWFRTVTRKTWDDQNFMSYDYAVNPLRGLFLWREAAEPALPVWIRYLLEFSAVDPTRELDRLRVPTLVIRPGLDDPGYFVDAGRDYVRDLTRESWRGLEGRWPLLRFATVPRSRLFIMYDQPEALDRLIEEFLAVVAPGAARGGR